jgi:NAD(P)H dehydrogenase (quinone)
MNPIAITGSTGKLGRLAIEQLKAKLPGAELIALARTPAKAANLGVAVRPADYSDPASLELALAGVQALLLVSSNEIGSRVAQHRNVIAAAKKSGVRWIVYTSLLHADTSAIVSLADEHLATEADLKASGLTFTILRNGWYTENYTASVPGAVAGGRTRRLRRSRGRRALLHPASKQGLRTGRRPCLHARRAGRGNLPPNRQVDPLQEPLRS